MGKPKLQGSSSTSTSAKAGKKAGSWIQPPELNKEKQRRRDAGNQQFQSREQFTQPVIKMVLDKKKLEFVEKVVHETIPFIWDETRKQFVYSARKETDN